jgi:hypothetical protein
MSQHFYPVRYEYGRVTRAVAAAVVAYAVGSALPTMPSWLGVLLRGTTVLLVMGGLLLVTRFFNPAELRALNALRRRQTGRRTTETVTDTTELAGEIVAVDMPEEIVADVDRAKN